MIRAERLLELPPEQAEPAAQIILDAWANPRLRYVPAFIDFTRNPKQGIFLSLSRMEAFYGGAAGPGKSTALLAAALQYVDVPHYAALLLRRTYQDLSLPGALMAKARDWLLDTDAQWHADTHTWSFPSGATLTFGYLQHEQDKERYKSAEFQFVGFDELTSFTETQYTYLFSRCRRPKESLRGRSPDGLGLSDVPLRVRSASNPGSDGHDWVKDRFVDPTTAIAVFIPARLQDNPFLDQEAYIESLSHLNDTDRERMLEGDWDAVESGGMFDPATFPIVEKRPDWPGRRSLRIWDAAGSEPTASYPDPDYSVGLLLDRDPASGQLCVSDVVRVRIGSTELEALVKATAILDGGHATPVLMEQEPGSAGKAVIATYSRQVLHGITSVHAYKPTGDKVTRARGASARAGRGEISVVRGPWLRDFFSEIRRFPNARHDDQVDPLSMGVEMIGQITAGFTSTRPTARLPARQQRRVG